MTHATLESILAQHAIALSHWPEMQSLVFDGTRPSAALLRRLRNVRKYAAALQSILIELSKNVEHKFPPKRNCKLSSHNAA